MCGVSESNSKHHTIPKCKKGKEIVLICSPCHKQIHNILSNTELEKQYSSIEKLKENEDIQKWIKWRQKHPNVFVSRNRKKRYL